MNRFSAIVLFFLVFCAQSCRIYERVLSHELKLKDIVQHSTARGQWFFFDLSNDNVDEMIASEDLPGYSPLYITDQSAKVMAQLNFPYPIRTIRALRDPGSGLNWLFYSFNDGKQAHLMASQYTWGRETKREDKRFEPLVRKREAEPSPRMEWSACIYPEFLEDIDGDARPELVCRALTGFEVHPRGLLAYDFISGKLKWYFPMSTTVQSLCIEDFDGNGSKELIFGTIALKNSQETLNGMDDMNGWTGVLNARGKLIYVDKVTDGYSEVQLTSADLGRDGKPDLIKVITTWGPLENRNSVSVLGFDGKSIYVRKKIDLAKTMERTQPAGPVHISNRNGDVQIVMIDKNAGIVALDSDLNPIPNRVRLFIRTFWDARDLDNDGHTEYLVQTEDDYFAVLDNKFRIRARLRNPAPGNNSTRLVVVNSGFGFPPLLAVSTKEQCRFYSYGRVSFFTILLGTFKSYSAWFALLFLLITIIMFLRSLQFNAGFRRILANMENGVLACRKNGKILYINEFLLDLIGRFDSDDRGKVPGNIREIAALTGNFGSFTQSLNQVCSNYIHVRYDNADHEIHIRYLRFRRFRPVYVITVSPVANIPDGVDQKMQWADTARRLSHNVRRHLSNVLLALDPLEHQCQKTLSNEENFRIIKSELEQVSIFTHAFQRFSELQDYDLKLQDIIPSLEHCLSRLNVPRGVKVVKNWNLDSVEAEIEPIRFEEALHNILTNALDAMTEHGVLHVSISRFPLHTSPKGNLSVLIEIDDNGSGIPKQYLKEIFKPFFTTKQSGTGIGIPETAKIIESMHGILDIQSEEGVGTTVSIWLKGE